MKVGTQLSLLARCSYGVNGLLGGRHQLYETLAVGDY